jgi:hypothetical protein
MFLGLTNPGFPPIEFLSATLLTYPSRIIPH